MKILQSSTFLLIFIFSSITGFSWGSDREAPVPENLPTEEEFVVEPKAPEVPASASTMDVVQNRNLLIVGVDQLTNDDIKLEGVWMLIYHRDNPTIEIIPIFPTMAGTDLMRDYTLAANFSFDEEGSLSEGFWNTLRERDILWHNYVLLDESALNTITDMLELTSAHDQGFLHTWQDDPDSSLNGQLTMFAQMCESFAQREHFEDIVSFIGELSPHLATDVSPEQVVSDWRLLRIYGENLRCEFPTLSVPQE